MQAISPSPLRTKVRRLTAVCLLIWLAVTLMPVLAARHAQWTVLGWPVDFWMAAQGCMLIYLLIVAVYAGLVNRWERQAGSLSFDVPPDQEV